MFTDRQKQFIEFVKEQHGDQERKYLETPYWKHPVVVATFVSPFARDYEMLEEIAFGHDLIEDTDCTYDMIESALHTFGYNVEEIQRIIEGIYHLTDQYTPEEYPELNREARKALEATRLSVIPAHIQNVKYADLIHNSRTIHTFGKGFAKVYFTEIQHIIDIMDDGDEELRNMVQQKIDDYINSKPVDTDA